ncbi:bifunctional hydroxymethylpyrimidine kinase/phosphomethylpyrimidine kinase (plasmid) [Halarchaeum sp. CBA1220]|uniref:bifunctional hydroxymethylpyrimidine kinase/phosphomethylpyrimidine kinase n=1 Tax=Halarchaeum sp. CBA1220 TaxID=1853682 RepID=UPI000F3A8F4D|nr:bifunctional hydroxymethylpyrimidine kinase/phosphomethylpyrimidine kinase [Halarchaeum sp. CBA1220]QLC35192.1 bifunctional hydroxymethylpyrimidine kinase/phosphomethylpyrimidine kinase [Halarchaeum sp. CBA1220]
MTRRAAPVDYPVALTVAGSDSGGAAGIQADLKTMEACGAYGTSVVTSVTAQNTRGVHGVHHLPPADVAAQLDAVRDDYDVRAVKTGMLGRADTLEAVVEAVSETDAPVVVDPVLVSTSGDALADDRVEAAYETLFAHATLLTPNADEAEALTGVDIESRVDARVAGERLREQGADAALVTGGDPYVEDDRDTAVDVLVTADDVRVFEHERVETARTHGSGCTLSSAIAARLAAGDALDTAVEAGIEHVARAVRYAHAVGTETGSVHHLAALRDDAERHATVEAVRALRAEHGDASVAGATPYAESAADVAAPDASGVVRFDVPSRPGELLLAAREHDPSLRYAATVPYDAEAWGEDGARTCAPDPSLPPDERVARAFEACADAPVLVDPSECDGDAATCFAADVAALRERLP